MTSPGPLRTCAACGTALSGPVCGSCGAADFEPQRRVVAVLFADLAGYTRLASELDPEAVHLLVRPLMNGLRRACTDLDGSVPAIEGDGLMAVFGAQRGSEDAPLRALTAAVRMQDLVADRRTAFGDDLPPLRIGINLGEVLVAPSWETDGFSVSGDAVNVASRLCSLAGTGEVLVASAVLAAVPDGLPWSEETRVEVRGRETAVAARRLRWREGRLPDSRRLLSRTPFVGRDDLLAELTRTGGRALLVGEPGVGKTRTAAEWVATTQPDAVVLRAGCPSFRAGDDALAVAELAAALPREWVEEAAPVVRRRLRRLRGEPVDSHEPDPVAAQVGALVEMVRARAATVVVVVDDVQWATGVELEALRALVDLPEVTVLATARRDGVPALPLARLDVVPLSEADSREVVQALLPGAEELLATTLTSRAGGVPLFLEQCVRLLVEERTVELTAQGAVVRDPVRLRQVPTAMRLFVTGRLDLLSEGERDVLAHASTAGDACSPDLLRHLCRDDVSETVEALVARDLLRWDEGPVLRFRHALVRDVAYEGQTRARRVDQHRAAAEWYAVRLPPAALAARAAHLEAALALSEGTRSVDCGLVREVFMALLAHAQGLLQERPASALDVLDRASAIDRLHGACDLESLDLDLLRAEAQESTGRHDDAAAAAGAALQRARELADPTGEAHALRLLAMSRVAVDRTAAAELFAEALAAYQGLEDPMGVALVESATAYLGQGDLLAGIPEAHARAYDAAQRAGNAALAATAAQMVAFHAVLRGRPHLEEWVANAEALARLDDKGGRARLLVGSAMVDLAALDPERALEAALEATDIASATGLRHVVSNALWVGCDAATLVGRLDQADVLLERAADHAAERPGDYQRFDVLVSRALLRGRQGRPDDADAALDEAAGIAGALGAAYDRELRWCRALRGVDSGAWGGVETDCDAVVAHDLGAEQPFLALRPRLLRLQVQVLTRRRVPFGECDSLRRDSRAGGAPAIDAIATRWLELDDLLRGDRPLIAVELPELPDLDEARAVDHALLALLERDPERLLEASAAWRRLGAVALAAAPLLWHAELTGDEHHAAEARELLRAAAAPAAAEQGMRGLVARVVH